MHRDDVVHRFGAFELDLTSRRLTRGPDVLPLTDPQFAVLEQLVLHAPAFVSKDALAKAGWGGKASNNSIEQVISSLRKVLTHAEGSSYIETERRRGYRIVAPVDRIERHDLLNHDHLDDETFRAFVRTNRELSTLKRDKVLGARRDLEQIVAQVPHYAPARVALATAYALSFEATRFDIVCDLGDLPRSVAQAREAIIIAPASADAWSSFGFALHLNGETDDAAVAAWKAVALAPGSWRHFVRLAFVSWGEERIDAAESALIRRPDLALAHWQKSTVFVARGALDAALAHLQAGCAAQDRQSADAELYPGIGCYLLRGLVLAEQGHLDEAIAEFTRELSGPDYGQIYSRECAANSWYAIGAVRLRQGDLAGADAAFRRALDLAPRHPFAMGALRLPLPVLAPDDPRSVDMDIGRAGSLVRDGRHQDAAAVYGRALASARTPNAGWILPVEPMLHATARPEIWGALLTIVRQRAT